MYVHFAADFLFRTFRVARHVFGSRRLSVPFRTVLLLGFLPRISDADSGITIGGVTGKHNGEKVRLLRGEGVKVDAAGGRVMGSLWSGFR